MTASITLAEGRNDPFLECHFEDDRQVILAEDGDLIEWRELDYAGTTQCTGGAPVICTTEHPAWGPIALVVANGASEAEERFGIVAGKALLTTVWFGPDVMSLSQTNGLCERIGR